jgi:hypothetical protein
VQGQRYSRATSQTRTLKDPAAIKRRSDVNKLAQLLY